jgi:sugar O-acyltransferase (sialic acid O-acetyltransferase NeuD family)
MTTPRILLVGAGGHARACIDVIECAGRFTIGGCIDAAFVDGATVLGYPLLGDDAALPAQRATHDAALVAIGHVGDTAIRRRMAATLSRLGFDLPTIISPRAHVARSASIGCGTVVMHDVVIGPVASVGAHCIVNTRAMIEHDAIIGDDCHVATGAIINGGVRIGRGVFVGSGAVIRPGVEVQDGAFIAMGARVTRDVAAEERVPAKALLRVTR